MTAYGEIVERVVWLVAGNKGNVGKSVVAKTLAGWLKDRPAPVIVIDGDARTSDVAQAFEDSLHVSRMRLDEDTGWREYADFIGGNRLVGHLVTNLPDGLTEKAIGFLDRFRAVAYAHGFTVKVLFVMNPLPDGLHVLSELGFVMRDVYPVKNLHFGRADEFKHFDSAYGNDYVDRTIRFPALNPQLMNVAREAGIAFASFATQKGNAKTNFLMAKLAVAHWYADACEALSDTLHGA